MTKYWTMLGILVARVAFGAEPTTNAPAKTPEELGRRVAQALVTGDTNAVGILLPTYEAYLPICAFSAGENTTNELRLRQYYARKMVRMRQEVHIFPAEFAKATTFNPEQIDGVDVVRHQEEKRTNWTDVDIVFKVKEAKFKLRLDECMRFSNAWYLVDFDWVGKEK